MAYSPWVDSLFTACNNGACYIYILFYFILPGHTERFLTFCCYSMPSTCSTSLSPCTKMYGSGHEILNSITFQHYKHFAIRIKSVLLLGTFSTLLLLTFRLLLKTQHLILSAEALYSSTLGKFGLDSEHKLYLYCFIKVLKKNKVVCKYFLVDAQ